MYATSALSRGLIKLYMSLCLLEFTFVMVTWRLFLIALPKSGIILNPPIHPVRVVAFEKMQIKDHTIMLEVPSQTLYEEIMRSKTEVLLAIARTAGITGSLELEVKVNEQIKASRPIKLEDRIKFMTEKNPLLLELKKALDMEYE